MSQKEIAKELGITRRKVQYWMHKHQIATRPAGETRKLQSGRLGCRQHGPRKTLPKALLNKQYIDQHLSIAAIAKANKWNRNLVSRELRRHNIPLRSRAETAKFIFNQSHIRKRRSKRTKGPNNPMYGKFGQQHGAWKKPERRKTPFYKAIRFCSEYKRWRALVFERDEYICQVCSKRGGELNVDHIVPLAIMLVENRITTVDEARDCAALWKIENGQTLCVTCHKKTVTYGQQLSRSKQLK